MANKDLFAPPSKNELKVAQLKANTEQDLFAPPSKEELDGKESPGLLSQGVDYGLRALDYPGGLVRTGLANVAGLVSGQGTIVKPEDLEATLKGQAPTSAQYLERLGVPEGPSVEIPVVGKTSLRDVGGFAVDVATDPMTAISKGVRALRPLSGAAESAGKSIYKSGLKRIDEEVAKYGKEPVSDLLMKRGITGSSKQIFEKMDVLGKELLAKRNDVLKKATRSGAEVNVPASLKEAQEFVNHLKKIDNPETKKAVQLLQGRIDSYMSAAAKEPEQILRELPRQGLVMPETTVQELGGYVKPERKFIDLPQQADLTPGKSILAAGSQSIDPNLRVLREADQVVPRAPVRGSYVESGGFTPGKTVIVPEKFIPSAPAVVLDTTERIPGPSPIQSTAWKTTSANNVGDPAWQILSQSAEGKGFDKALSKGLRRGTEESVEKAIGRDAAEELINYNDELGRILSSKERALLDAVQEARKNAITSVDGIAAAAGGPGVLAAKKAADLSKTTWARTKLGKGLMDTGKSGLLDELVRRGLININNPDSEERNILLNDEYRRLGGK